MKYLFWITAGFNTPEIEILKEEYAEHKKSYNILQNALAIEEKYEILISNYLAFEKQILCITVNYTARQHLDYSDFFEVRLGLNICLVNFLTAARLYIDQLGHNVRECVPDDVNIKETIKKNFACEYDNNKEYRFMEALRNHVQHRGIPVHLTKQGGRNRLLEGNEYKEHYINLFSLSRYLKEDSSFKKKVISELNDSIDLKLATRIYMESLSNVHESSRSLISEPVSLARKHFEKAHKKYSPIFKSSMVGLNANEQLDDGKIDSIPLLLDWDDIRVKLQNRNKKLVNLRSVYATGSI